MQKYYHGESISVNVLVDNNAGKTVKKIKISGEQKNARKKFHFFWLVVFIDKSVIMNSKEKRISHSAIFTLPFCCVVSVF